MINPNSEHPSLAAEVGTSKVHPANGFVVEGCLPAGQACPRLGNRDDPATYYPFPAKINCCYQVRPATAIKLQQQSDYCLSSNYKRCPLYCYKEVIELPARGKKLKRVHGWRARKPKSLAIWFHRLGRPAQLVMDGLLLLTIVTAALLPAVSWYNRVTTVVLPPTIPVAAVSDLSPVATGEELTPSLPVTVTPSATQTPVATTVVAIVVEPTATTRPSATPTRTPQPSATPTTSPTATPTTSPTATATVPTATTTVPTASATPAVIPTMAGTTTACPLPAGWQRYIVRPNDTLFRLGLPLGATVAELQRANCMGESKQIYVGQVLYLPDPSVTPTPRATRPLLIEP